MNSNTGTQEELVIYTGKVVGVTFEPTKTHFKACIAELQKQGEDKMNPVLKMKHNPDNEFDPNAVEIWLGHDKPNHHIGFIPRTHNRLMLLEGLDTIGIRLLKANLFEDKIVGFGIEVFKKG